MIHQLRIAVQQGFEAIGLGQDSEDRQVGENFDSGDWESGRSDRLGQNVGKRPNVRSTEDPESSDIRSESLRENLWIPQSCHHENALCRGYQRWQRHLSEYRWPLSAEFTDKNTERFHAGDQSHCCDTPNANMYLIFALLLFTPGAWLQNYDYDEGRIVGGQLTSIDSHPYQVSLRYNNRHVCGAAIISEEWIITAAHCVQGSFMRYVSIKAGVSNLNDRGFVIRAQDIIVHEDYSRDTSDSDIALIKLERPLSFGPRVSAISLASGDSWNSNSGTATVTGWGVLRSHGSLTNQLRQVDVPLISSSQCSMLYKGRMISSKMLCAGYVNTGGKDACQGDSGGPLVQGGRLIGIVSWGFGCAEPAYPGVYTRVAYFRSWIRSETGL
ncbi:trypsin delta-like [Prorops nasuta]|uniref:trypsin delta-like n=1 Tax=Prorops nasuta TaxID=863751 RepID=UPI0034CD9CF6